MWPYLLVFVAALVVDTIPIFAPPAWILFVIILVKFHLNPWVTLAVGVTGSTIGRYILTRYVPKISSSLVNRREDKNLRYIGSKLAQAKWSSAMFVFFYTSLHHGALHGRRGRAHHPVAHPASFLSRPPDH